MVNQLLTPVLVLGLMGLAFGVILAISAKIFEVKVDERVPLVRAVLPGANCGGCGLPGCDALAVAIVKGEASVNACPVGGSSCAENIADIMGVAAGSSEPNVACINCKGGCTIVESRADYYGIQDCREVLIANGGIKACRYGCMGFGTCINACAFDALKMGTDGLPIVDVDKCTACGKCVEVCPKSIVELVPYSQRIHVDCRSLAKGKLTKNVCSVGCIGCRACVKVCEADAISVNNNLAHIDYSKCTQCGACVEKCPTNAITLEERIIPQKDSDTDANLFITEEETPIVLELPVKEKKIEIEISES